MKLFKTLLKLRDKATGDKSGATVIEYCLIAGIICIAIVGGATAAGNATNGAFNRANAGFSAATSS
ncbi:MAG TPA: Flp family type IVb pilin [Hyphomonadaceae bacterium]|jgi:pilus assembly protein Flp/PilA|nr:Flp family type IVb pilin [Hyphomonadaceae bacterium]